MTAIRACLLALATGTIAACSGQAEEIRDCEASLLRDLRSPSTYKRIKAETTRLTNKVGAEYQMVEIEYDAANAYGTPIRDTALCAYPVTGTDVRVDLTYFPRKQIRDAQLGLGLFRRDAKLPSRREFSDAMLNDTHQNLLAPFASPEMSEDEETQALLELIDNTTK